MTKEYEKQHNEKMKTERKERQRTYTQMVNHSRNCVADELFDYVNAPNYYNERVKAVSNYDKTDDFDICR